MRESHYWGHAVWPSPVVIPAEIVTEPEGRLHSEDRRNPVADGIVFREDSFDPVTRIRRGRFYQVGNRQPSDWHVQVHPAVPNEALRCRPGNNQEIAGYLLWAPYPASVFQVPETTPGSSRRQGSL